MKHLVEERIQSLENRIGSMQLVLIESEDEDLTNITQTLIGDTQDQVRFLRIMYAFIEDTNTLDDLIGLVAAYRKQDTIYPEIQICSDGSGAIDLGDGSSWLDNFQNKKQLRELIELRKVQPVESRQ